jgi:hypothetical protein
MEFVRTHLISLICAAVALGAIGAAVMGMSSRSVVQAMEARKRDLKADQIGALKTSAKNQEIIEREKERGNRFQEEYDKTVKVAIEINQRQPIMEDVFPTFDRLETPFRFREAYRDELARLPAELLAGKLPDAAEIQEENEAVRDLQEREREKAQETQLGPASGRTPAARQPETVFFESGGGSPRGGVRGGFAPPASGQATEPRFDPTLRARVNKAKSIRTYINDGTFHKSPLVAEGGTPSLTEMWKAQVSLWIQQDIIKAIADLNKEAADRVKDGEAHVEHMPVKHVVGILVRGYQTASGFVPFASITAPSPPPAPPSFTGRSSDAQFDVLRFTVQVVAQQQDLLKIVDRISRVNFYKNVGMQYEPVPAGLGPGAGYVYGAAPVVLATLEFEAYQARAIYDKWIPKDMKSLLSGGKGGEEP